MENQVRILRPSLDDLKPGQTVLRGVIHPEDLEHLRNDFYQREKLPVSSRRDIMLALESGTQLPDVELGMRGDRFRMDDDHTVTLVDPVFIVDGRQRIETTREYLLLYPEEVETVRLGAVIHFNSDASTERARFHKLNTSRVKVSPSLLLRNNKDDTPALAMLYGLSVADASFPLQRRITWAQNAQRDDLISGLQYVRLALRMHAHLVPARSTLGVDTIPPLIARLQERIGMPMIRANVMTFWQLVEQAWGIGNRKIRQELPYMRSGFMEVLVDILADHVDFWMRPDETKLFVPYELRRKLEKFPVYDPEVMRLAGSAGKAREALYFILLTHINSGKRTRRLVPRNVRATIPENFEDEGDGEDEAAA